MKDVSRVGITQGIVFCDSKSRKPFGSVLLILRGLGMLIGHAFTPGVVGKQGQTVAH